MVYETYDAKCFRENIAPILLLGIKMDFKFLNHEQIDELITGKLSFDNTLFSPIMTAHLFLERVLEELIKDQLVFPDQFLKENYLRFDSKIKLALALGVLEENHFSAFKALNRIRNKLAHDWDYSLSDKELNSLKVDWTDIQKTAFKKALGKGTPEAARIAVIFLCWEALSLVKEPKTNE